MNALYKNPKKSAYLIVLFLALFSTVYNAYVPLHGDEAYYWTWSHHLQGGYFDHPPMIAYLIYLSNFISESEWGVRLVNVLSMSTAALVIFKMTQEIINAKAALNAVLIFSSIVIVHAGFTLVTPDSPLILFWSLGLYFTYRALFFSKTKEFFLAGLFIGAMMLSKYTAILFVASVLIFVLIKRRSVLLDWRFYMTIVITSIVVSPLLIWNAQHEWISFTFQLNQHTDKPSELLWNYFWEFFGGQFATFSPVFAGILFYYLAKKKLFIKDDILFYLALNVVVVIGFFMYKSLFGHMELNYGAPAYIAAAIIVAWAVHTYQLNKLFTVGLFIALLFSLLARIGILFYLEIVQDRMYGNKEAIALMQTYYNPNKDTVYGDHLTTTALASFYLKGHPQADVGVPTRYSQYDMWRQEGTFKSGLVFAKDDELKALQTNFSRVEELDTLTVQRGLERTKTFHIYRVWND